MASMLEAYDSPAILVTVDYQILATNALYVQQFGAIDLDSSPSCYRVSHGYDRPCDQAGEACPLHAARESGHKERVLHVHQTPRGKEHVDVEMVPIYSPAGELEFFVELLHSVPTASTKAQSQKMVGSSPAFNRMLEAITRVAPSEAAILLNGESGTGKELAAQAIHDASARAGAPMVTLECAGLSETLFESELFGHVRGAFTGAQGDRKGLVEMAQGGTLFLDEIGDVPLAMQVKLLRLLESRMYRPVGSEDVRVADFRLICATHKNIAELIQNGAFREDLFYRINVFPIELPALRERFADLPLLSAALLSSISPKKRYHLTDTAMARLKLHPFPGNIRELRNILTRAVLLSDTNIIEADTIKRCFDTDQRLLPAEPDTLSLKDLERNYFARLMALYDGDKHRVASTAGISVRSLYRKLQAAGA